MRARCRCLPKHTDFFRTTVTAMAVMHASTRIPMITAINAIRGSEVDGGSDGGDGGDGGGVDGGGDAGGGAGG